MSYAEEREYTPSERAIVITQYILEMRPRQVTIEEVMRVGGCGWWAARRSLMQLERVLGGRLEGRTYTLDEEGG